MKKKILAMCSALILSAGVAAGDYDRSSDVVQQWLDDMSEREGVSQEVLEQFIADAKRRQDIIDLISKPAERVLSWADYRRIFMDQPRIDGGVAFWNEHREVLAKVAAETGVPEEYIVAIIGVETRYGRIMGNHRVIDALATLAFDYPKRAAFFRVELANYFRLTQKHQLPANELKGSYAGAMGMGQFMPSSYLSYAVDQTGDGVADIWTNPDDAIASVANYFRAHGWQAGNEVVSPLIGAKDLPHDRKLKLDSTVAEISALGVNAQTEAPLDTKAKIFKFEGESTADYWMALPNFYVITRYNHSHYYAMAAHLLSQEIKRKYQAQ